MSRKQIIIDGFIENIKHEDHHSLLILDLKDIRNNEYFLDIEPFLFKKYFNQHIEQIYVQNNGTIYSDLPFTIYMNKTRLDMFFINYHDRMLYSKSFQIDSKTYELYDNEYKQFKRVSKLERICNGFI